MQKKKLSAISALIGECIVIAIFDLALTDVQSIFHDIITGANLSSTDYLLLGINALLIITVGFTGYWIYLSFFGKKETTMKETIKEELKQASLDFLDNWPRIRAVVAEYTMAPFMQRSRLMQIGSSFKDNVLRLQEVYNPYFASMNSKKDDSEEFVQKLLEAKKVQATIDRFSALSDKVIVLGSMLEKVTPDFKEKKGLKQMGKKIFNSELYEKWTKKFPDSDITKELRKEKDTILPILIDGDEVHSELETELDLLDKL